MLNAALILIPPLAIHFFVVVVYNTASLPCGANHTWHLTTSLILQTFHHMGCMLFCVRKIASKMSTLRKMKSFSQFELKSPCLTESAVFWHNAICYHVHRQNSTLFILSCPIWSEFRPCYSTPAFSLKLLSSKKFDLSSEVSHKACSGYTVALGIVRKYFLMKCTVKLWHLLNKSRHTIKFFPLAIMAYFHFKYKYYGIEDI